MCETMEVTVTMSYSEKNGAALNKYVKLVKKHYPEPEDGKFKDPYAIQPFQKWAWPESSKRQL